MGFGLQWQQREQLMLFELAGHSWLHFFHRLLWFRGLRGFALGAQCHCFHPFWMP